VKHKTANMLLVCYYL